ncbi:transmembrane and coiled-coil domains-containing protein 7 [Apophysomyces sp. BC1021]|nr:transmembrane and coiled-coil domains-containing protein 7 [Apophysomyces sp. BC1021]
MRVVMIIAQISWLSHLQKLQLSVRRVKRVTERLFAPVMTDRSDEIEVALATKHDIEKDRLKTLLLQATMLVGNVTSEKQDVSLEEQLTSRLEQLQVARDEKSDKAVDQLNPQEAFVDACLTLLISIQNCLLSVISTGEGQVVSDRDLLGVRDLRLIHTMLQVIISWGLYPCFLPGVGVPLSKRVKSGYTNHELLTRPGEDKNTAAPSLDSARRLLDYTTQLTDLLLKSQQVAAAKDYTTAASIIMTRHLPDLYAALLQLAYAPITGNKSTGNGADVKPVSPADVGKFMASQPIHTGISREERDKCARMFMWLFERSDAYRAMETLMLLLGTSPLHPVPQWLRNICGRFLSRILLKPNGVAIVLEFTIGDVDQVQLPQLEKIAKLILSVPQQMPSVESYYGLIAPQLLVLLQEVVHSKQQSPKSQAVTFLIGRMISKHAGLTKTYIVDKIVGPLLQYWNQEEYAVDATDHLALDPEAMTENDVYTMLYTLHSVMVGGEPSPVVIQTFLAASIPALYHLYEFTVQSKSGLRETILDLLTTYFRIMTPKDVIDDLKTILFDKLDLSGARVAYFAPGPSGGVSVRLRREPKVVGGNQLPVDTQVMIDFLQAVNSPDLCGDFFIFLLNEYSSSQSISRSIDPKIMLITLQLIMGMLDSQGPEILKKPTQIIAFANNVVVEHADRINKPKKENDKNAYGKFPDLTNIVSDDDREAMEGAYDDTFSAEDDFEALVLATSLLRAVMHENEDLDQQAVHLLESALGPLKQLESHPVEAVQESVHEIVLSITSYLSSQKLSGGKTKSGSQDEASKARYRDAMKALQDDLLPVRAHGIGILKEMVLAKDPLVSSGEGLDTVLDLLVHLVQDEDSFIYLNAIKGLSALTDIHGNLIITKLGHIYSDENEKLDNRLRIGEALLQTVQRCGDALSRYVIALVKPLEAVLARRHVDKHLRVSALSIMSMACQTCPVALTGQLQELTDWVLNILEFEKAPEIRRASETLYEFPIDNLRRAYRTLRYIEDTDADELTRYQARVALSDLDMIMRGEIFKK